MKYLIYLLILAVYSCFCSLRFPSLYWMSHSQFEHQFLTLFSNKKASSIADDVWDAAISAEVTTVNLSKNTLNEVPSR